jgi:hypothetical protein
MMTELHIFDTHHFEHLNSLGKFLVAREMT